jgi:hypothetical protein
MKKKIDVFLEINDKEKAKNCIKDINEFRSVKNEEIENSHAKLAFTEK